jgi:hypothetical protein
MRGRFSPSELTGDRHLGEQAVAELVGRRGECEALDRLLADVLAGTSRVLVLRGDAGVGKSALLGYMLGRMAGWRVVSAVGVESEMELAFSGLHRLCAPLLDHLDELPPPQHDALATVFGLSAGPAPDRFLVGLATLTLMAQAAEEGPLACIVDDALWLDRASAQIIGFVARRLLAERVALVYAARTGTEDGMLAGLPTLLVGGLQDADARRLLLGNVHGPLDAAVIDQIIAESHGNPLALLEPGSEYPVVTTLRTSADLRRSVLVTSILGPAPHRTREVASQDPGQPPSTLAQPLREWAGAVVRPP